MLNSTFRVAQVYELLRMDMSDEEVQLAAAAPPGLLDAARAQWARRDEIEKEVRTSFMQCSMFSAWLCREFCNRGLKCHVKGYRPGWSICSATYTLPHGFPSRLFPEFIRRR